MKSEQCSTSSRCFGTQGVSRPLPQHTDFILRCQRCYCLESLSPRRKVVTPMRHSCSYNINLTSQPGEYTGMKIRGQNRIKNLPPTQKTQGPRVQSWGWEVSLEQEMATHSSILAWRIPWTEEPGGLQSMGLQRAGHDSTAQARMEMLQRSSARRVLLDPGRGLISAPPIPSRNLDHPHPTQPHCVSGQLGGGGSPLEKRSEAGRAAAAASLLTPPRCVPLLHPSEAGHP